jgi:hypothetical protein
VGAGPPTAAGRDLPSPCWQLAGLLPRGGGRGAGSWRPRSCSLSTCRRQTARARPGPAPPPPPPPLRLQPRRRRRSPSGARAEPRLELARYRARLWAGRPSPRAPARQVRVRAGRISSAGKGDVPAPQSFGGDCGSPHPGPVPPGAAGCLRAALRRALRLHHRSWVTGARLPSACPRSMCGDSSGPATVKSLHRIDVWLKFPKSA